MLVVNMKMKNISERVNKFGRCRLSRGIRLSALIGWDKQLLAGSVYLESSFYNVL